MKISPIAAAQTLSTAQAQPSQAAIPGSSFQDIMKRVGSKEIEALDHDHKVLSDFEKTIETQASLSPQELLSLQIRASRLHMKVEMVSRAGEAVATSARRLQQGGS